MFEDFLAGAAGGSSRGVRGRDRAGRGAGTGGGGGAQLRHAGLPLQGKPLLGFSEAKAHLNLHPFSPAAIDPVRERLADYRVLKGTVTFTPERPLPPDAVAEIVTARKAEIDR